MDIYAEPARLLKKSNDIVLLNSELQNIMTQIEALILSVGGSWQGESEKAYASKILFVKRQFSNIFGFLADYASLLERCALQYQQQDDQLQQKINLS